MVSARRTSASMAFRADYTNRYTQDSAASSVLNSRMVACTSRERLRMIDIAESRALLLELALYEPNLSQCFSILSDSCLSDDIRISVDGRTMSDRFHRYFNYHYQQFCREAVRAMYLYGFVPWHPRKLASGDIVPVVLAHGTFSWRVQTIDTSKERQRLLAQQQKEQRGQRGQGQNHGQVQGHRGSTDTHANAPASGGAGAKEHAQHHAAGKFSEAGRKRKFDAETRAKRDQTEREGGLAGREYMLHRWGHLDTPENDNLSKQVQHVVDLTHSSLQPSDVFIFDVEAPVFNVMENSMLHATLPSPLAHLLPDYRNLRDALARRSHADAWNTTARIFTSCTPPNIQNSEPTNSYLYYETGSDRTFIGAGRSHMDARHRELHNQITQPSNHIPVLYNLPVHHKLEQLPSLTPCEDVMFLLDKFRRDVCGVLGVPYEMVFGRTSGGQETNARSNIIGRLFSKTVQRICLVLQELVGDAYSEIYGTARDRIEVAFNPMPRLDISSIDDVKQLWEMGAVTPDIVAQLSEIMLLSHSTNVTGPKRETTHSAEAYKQNFKEMHKAMKPPNPTSSSAAQQQKKKKQKTS